jgi:NAD-dependent SIR2 family protein deacetylase
LTYQVFMGDAAARQRYWARSMAGWPRFDGTRPNGAHYALARLEEMGKCELLLTQNVDRPHQAAGSTRMVDLHGRLDLVRCMGCERRTSRAAFQEELGRLNPIWAALGAGLVAGFAPDGDADLEAADFSSFVIPLCHDCGGVLKPDVVFYGENVPRERVEAGVEHLAQADAMLIVGSSLMVWSGFRFVQAAARG